MTKAKDQRPKTTEVAAIILAAGHSRRMGAFKPLLPFGPQTVIQSCIRSLRAAGINSIVVVVGRDTNAEALRSRLLTENVLIAVNPDPRSEMSASIATGVAAVPAETKAVIITPADHPAVPPEVVTKLIDEWRDGALLAKPTWNERGGHPVLVDLSFRKELEDLDPDAGLQAFFSSHQDQVRRIAVQSNYVARDMDTWDDYHALHLDVFGVAPPPREPGE